VPQGYFETDIQKGNVIAEEVDEDEEQCEEGEGCKGE